MKKIENLTQKCKAFFDQTAEKVSLETGFIKRKRKISGSSFLKALVLAHMDNPHASINVLCQWLAEDKVKITKQGLDCRFNETGVQFMKAMYEESLTVFGESLALPCTILEQFKSVKIQDSTYITLPPGLEKQYKGYGTCYRDQTSKAKAAIKLQCTYDYLHQKIDKIEITEGIRSDQGYRGHLSTLQAEELWIADLGYFVPEVFKKMQERGAYFISRYKADTNLYDAQTQEQIDLLGLLHGRSSLEQDIILGKKSQIGVRIIGYKLTHEQSMARRRKANLLAKARKYRSSARNQKLLDWSLFITNLSKEKMKSKEVIALYRARWQIELLFKLYKSHIKLCHFQGKKPARVLCELYAKLCIVALFHSMTSCIKIEKHKEISKIKAFIHLRRQVREFFLVLAQSLRKIKCFLRKMIEDWSTFALKDPCCKSKISTLQSLKKFSVPLT